MAPRSVDDFAKTIVTFRTGVARREVGVYT